jgi:hypothetical protein
MTRHHTISFTVIRLRALQITNPWPVKGKKIFKGGWSKWCGCRLYLADTSYESRMEVPNWDTLVFVKGYVKIIQKYLRLQHSSS